MSLEIVRTRKHLRETVEAWKRDTSSVGLVPTMGALHEGHLSLVRAALGSCERVIVTLFVNPKQFNSAADLTAYPRTEDADAAMLSAAGAHLLYAPEAGEIYPAGFATTVSVAGVTDDLEGAHRPGHFDGVSTVVAKLLLQAGAQRAYFGEKDFQQLQLVRRMARDLDIPVEIVGCPTIREGDGLAMSSRNVRLSVQQRATAPELARALSDAAARLTAGEPAERAIAEAANKLLRHGFRAVDYVALRAAADFRALDAATEPARLLAAAWLGEVRLIDNVPVEPASPRGEARQAALSRT